VARSRSISANARLAVKKRLDRSRPVRHRSKASIPTRGETHRPCSPARVLDGVAGCSELLSFDFAAALGLVTSGTGLSGQIGPKRIPERRVTEASAKEVFRHGTQRFSAAQCLSHLLFLYKASNAVYFMGPGPDSSFASAKIFCIPLGTGVNPTSVLHKRRQQVARFLDPGHIPQRPRPLADCLVVEFVLACRTNDHGKRVSARINSQTSKLVRPSHEFLGLSSSGVMLDDREHGPQVPVDRIPTSILLKIIPSIANVPEPLSQ